MFHEGGLDALVVRELGLDAGEPDLEAWDDFVDARAARPSSECVIGVVGKYTHVRDAYKSIIEAFVHAGAANRARVELRWVEGEDVESERRGRRCSRDVDGVLVPGGFGERGIEGKIAGGALRARARRPVLRPLPRHAGRDHRVRAQRRGLAARRTRASSTRRRRTR